MLPIPLKEVRGFDLTSRQNSDGKLDVRKNQRRDISRMFERSVPTSMPNAQVSIRSRKRGACPAVNKKKHANVWKEFCPRLFSDSGSGKSAFFSKTNVLNHSARRNQSKEEYSGLLFHMIF